MDERCPLCDAPLAAMWCTSCDLRLDWCLPLRECLAVNPTARTPATLSLHEPPTTAVADDAQSTGRGEEEKARGHRVVR
jgi:hypothetical protein